MLITACVCNNVTAEVTLRYSLLSHVRVRDFKLLRYLEQEFQSNKETNQRVPGCKITSKIDKFAV